MLNIQVRYGNVPAELESNVDQAERRQVNSTTETGFRRESAPTRSTEETLEARMDETVLRMEVIEAAERIVSGGC